MKWPLIFLVSLSLATACVVEDRPVNGTGGSPGTGATGGDPTDECGGCSGDTPVCDAGTMECVQCLPGMDTACDATTPVCDPTDKVCVCTSDEDCTDPSSPRCNSTERRCEACSTNDDCEGIEGPRGDLTICDAGTCVECTVQTEPEICGAVACNPLTNECTGAEIGSLDVCDECVADSECGDGSLEPSDEHRCVPMFYPNDSERFPDESAGFCLKAVSAGCEQPYSIRLDDRVSLSDAPPDNYCGIDESLTTCPAVNDLLSNVRCDGGVDEECFQPGGICRQVGVLPNRCTYRCGLAAQCPGDAPADTCGAGDTELDDYCGG